ncbi:MAG: NAD-dependent epimerase/dehydratase family protein [Nanoarchaeota archaeon]|nr:NAD-dependent epimerase/dehydratase family protein [Nanoarchaeota archaeon]MBU1050993.1 NAD-dependent epimerase/dehydratase family protein [Nanoarchaeota archaeon]MBU1988034.1 NAD-dependent epimerase/dehydratase family protein [Nanoarchaeota archaeon]
MKVAITGISGGIGTGLTKKLLSDPDLEKIIGIDIRPPKIHHPKIEFHNLCVSSPQLREIIPDERPDTLVHLAWMVSQNHNQKKEYRTDVLGSQNVLKACSEVGVRNAIVTSTGKVYGMRVTNSHIDRFTEESPLVAEKQLTYVKHKILLEQMCADFAQQHPETSLTVFRPCTVLGEHIDTPITRSMKNKITSLMDYNPERQFVDEEDVVATIYMAITQPRPGVFNIASDTTVPQRKLHQHANKPHREILSWMAEVVLDAGFKLHLSKINSQALSYLKHSIVISNGKLKREFPYKPKFTTEQVLERFGELTN